jgi:L-asparagine oxygenase
MWTSVVPQAARDELARAFAECGPLREDPEPFLASVFARIGCLPVDLTRSLLQFRGDPSATGILLIQGMPIDRKLPPTPTTSDAAGAKETYVSEASILLIALMLGDPVAYADEKNGVLVQNVYPIETEKRSPSNESSETDLGFHTELSFSRNAPKRPLHAANPDFLLLLGLRPAPLDDAVTTLVESDDICKLLSVNGRATLSEPLFELRAPYSFTHPNGVERIWSRPVPLLHGSDGTTLMAFDLACGVRGLTSDASRALDELRHVVAKRHVQQEVRLGAGDLLVVHNRKCAHARSRFMARFDGTDRWLQRVYVRRSVEGLERASPRSFRVL